MGAKGTGVFMPRCYEEASAQQKTHGSGVVPAKADGYVPPTSQQRNRKAGSSQGGSSTLTTTSGTAPGVTLRRVPWQAAASSNNSSAAGINGFLVGSCPPDSHLLARSSATTGQSHDAVQSAHRGFNRSSSCGSYRNSCGPSSNGRRVRRSSSSGGSSNVSTTELQLPVQDPLSSTSSATSPSGSGISLLTHSRRVPQASNTVASASGAAAVSHGVVSAAGVHELWGPQSCGGSPLSCATAFATLSGEWAFDLPSPASDADVLPVLPGFEATAVHRSGTLFAARQASTAAALGGSGPASSAGVTFIAGLAGKGHAAAAPGLEISADTLPIVQQQQQPSASAALIKRQQQQLLMLPQQGGQAALGSAANAATASFSSTAALADTVTLLEQQLAAVHAGGPGEFGGSPLAGSAAAPAVVNMLSAGFHNSSSQHFSMDHVSNSCQRNVVGAVPLHHSGVFASGHHSLSGMSSSHVGNGGCGSSAGGYGSSSVSAYGSSGPASNHGANNSLCSAAGLHSIAASDAGSLLGSSPDGGALLGSSPDAWVGLMHHSSSRQMLSCGNVSTHNLAAGGSITSSGVVGCGFAAAPAGSSPPLPGPLGASMLLQGGSPGLLSYNSGSLLLPAATAPAAPAQVSAAGGQCMGQSLLLSGADNDVTHHNTGAVGAAGPGQSGSAFVAAQQKLQELMAVEQMQQQLQAEFLKLLPLI